MDEIYAEITRLEKQMHQAAQAFEFEKAAGYRDRIKFLRELDIEVG